jgi:drug/metabolite transporter (DMT)-like permease
MIEGAVRLREPIPLIMGAAAVLVLASVFIVLRAEDERPATLGLNASAGIE